ncbi:MAG TPA: TonB family protein [Puia sp.]|nr:TonB family protein [Puia sp.]
MELNQIKDAHFLDILFEGRNKEYGAYVLRKTYNRRMVKSMVVMGSVVAMICVGGAVTGFGKGVKVRPIEIADDTLISVNPHEKEVIIPPVPKVQPQVATIRMTMVKIVPDEQVKPDEKPPENDAANEVHIGTETKAGDLPGDIVGPPSNGTTAGVIAAPKKEEEAFIPIEKEAEFPGGAQAWARFLGKTLRYPEEALNMEVEGTVMVQFVVDADGNVSEVQAVSGPEKGGLREEAVRVIKKSGKWVPALQNGRYVKAYRRQPIIFKQLNEN